MNFSISPYNDDSLGNQPMKPWPALAGKGFYLKCNSKPEGSLFFFDSVPSNGDAAAPVVVLIHGLGDEADSWRYVIPLLSSRGYRALALDLPGFGRSVTPGKISIKNHAAAVGNLIESAGQNGMAVFLAGNSIGAMIAETVALKKPELVRGLILIDGSIPGGPSNPGLFALAKLLLSRKWYRAYRDNPDGAWASLRPYYADLESMPEADRKFLRQRVMERVESSTQERAFFQTQRSLIWAYLTASSRFARGIRDYKGKILLLWGGKDRVIPQSSAETFKALRDDIELKIINGAGHLPQQEKPEETAMLMADFMAGINGR